MSNKYEGVKCPVCNGYLFENEDDIAVCPICGAPHHRACYHSLGHCGLESLHGTEQQYDKAQRRQQADRDTEQAKENLCPHCGKPLGEDMLFCPHCGKMRGETAQPEPEQKYRFMYNQIDPLGGVHPATDLGEGVTAKQAAEFVKVNTARYIPKFASSSKVSWNWLAFLLPHGFFFYHKMYKAGILVSVVYLASIILGLPWQAEMIQFSSTLPVNYTRMELFTAFFQNGSSVSSFLLFLASMVISLLLSVLCGVFADYWYKNHVIHQVKQLSTLEPEEREAQYLKKGLPNLYLLLLVTLVFSWIPNILYILFF